MWTMRNHLMGVTKTKQAHPEDAPKENLGQLHVFETSVPIVDCASNDAELDISPPSTAS